MISARQILAALGVALLVGGAPACSYGREGATFAPGPASPVTFDFFRDSRIFLPVQVNGHAVEALLDSGAGIVTMDKAYAAQLGIVPTGDLPLSTSGGAARAQIATGVTITVGGLRLENVRVAIIDLSQVAAGMGRPLPLVLGRDAFDAFIVDIDFPGRKIAFHDPASFHGPPGAVRLPLTPTLQKVRETPLALEGNPPEPATFDLGNGTALSVSREYAARHHLLEGRAKAEALAGGVGGVSVHDIAMVKSIRFGGTELKDVPALINRAADELPAKGLNVGMPVLSRFRLIIDYGHDALFLIPNAAAVAQPFRKDRAGLGATFRGDHLEVLFVTPGSPAQIAGWKVGEKIVAIDGEPVGPKFYSGAHALWSTAAAGETVAFTLDDGSKRRLILKDYY